MKFDGHSHTHYSTDAGTSPKTHIKLAQKLGLVMAVTDHNTTKGWDNMAKFSRIYNQPIVYGEEIKIEENGKVIGEMIGLFMNEEIPQGALYEVYDKLRSQGALIVIPHPFDNYRKPLLKSLDEKEREIIAKKVDVIEGYNARCYFQSYNDTTQEFAKTNGLTITAGSDAHFASEIGNAYIEVNVNEIEELRTAIKGEKKIIGHKSSYWNHFKTQIVKFQKKIGMFRYID